MSRKCIVTVLVGVLFLINGDFAWAGSNDGAYDGKQIILSWTKDNAHTQTITWSSKTRKGGYVQYNEEGRRLSENKQVKAKVTEITKDSCYRYEATIKGLHQKTVYKYRIGDGVRWSETRRFVTAPMEPDSLIKSSDKVNSFAFLYLGDVQYKNRNKDYGRWGNFLQRAYDRNPKVAFGLLGGDMVNYPDSMKEWNLFLDNATGVFSKIPMMPAIGNHETSKREHIYSEMFALPENGPDGKKEEFYSFDYGGCHIVVLNTNFFLESVKKKEGEAWQDHKDTINTWLSEDLEKSDAKWKIAVIHHPAFGISDGDSIYEQVRKEWTSRFQYGKVDLVLSGHQHIYMRSKNIGGITYVMGNSGQKRSNYYNGENFPDYGKALDATNSNYQIIRVTEKKLSLTSYDEKGQIIDKWTKKSSNFITDKIAVVVIALLGIGLLLILGRVFLWRKDT